jgi:hypothetical protein
MLLLERHRDMAKFRDIPQFPRAHYEVDVAWSYLEQHIAGQIKDGLNLEPEFQRAHVWLRNQQIAYVEYVLSGGEVGRNLTFNCSDWDSNVAVLTGYEIVDGKQRLEAARAFMRGDIPAFGHLFSEYEDRLSSITVGFKWRICKIESRKELLQLYLNINAGGTPHTKAELDKVRKMLENEK